MKGSGDSTRRAWRALGARSTAALRAARQALAAHAARLREQEQEIAAVQQQQQRLAGRVRELAAPGAGAQRPAALLAARLRYVAECRRAEDCGRRRLQALGAQQQLQQDAWRGAAVEVQRCERRLELVRERQRQDDAIRGAAREIAELPEQTAAAIPARQSEEGVE